MIGFVQTIGSSDGQEHTISAKVKKRAKSPAGNDSLYVKMFGNNSCYLHVRCFQLPCLLHVC